MAGVIAFFEGIGNFIVSITDFVISFFQDLIYMIGLTGKVVGSIPSYFSWLPSQYVTLIVSIIGVVVVYKILGREG